MESPNKKTLNASETTGLLSGGKGSRVLPRFEAPDGHARNGSEIDLDKKAKKKKCIIVSIVVSVAVIVIISIILAVVLKKDDDNPPGPEPGPPGPIPPGSGVNPYNFVQDDSYKVTLSEVSGHLKANTDYLYTLRKKRQTRGQFGDQVDNIGVIDPLNIPSGENNQIVEDIYFELGQSNDLVSYLHLNDVDKGRYSVPEQVIDRPMSDRIRRLESVGLSWNLNPFSFKFTDTRNNSNVLLSTDSQNLFIMDKYLQVDFKLPSQRVFGLGERSTNFMLNEGTWTMWANGKNTTYDDGSGGLQSHGVQPFALIQTAIPGQFMGIFFRNSNAQSPVLYHNDDGTSTLSYITTGGAIEIYFFWKGNAKQIIKKYQQTFGTPAHPPLWALGWQVSSKSFKSQSDVEKLVSEYKNSGIPLEGVWLDVAYQSTDEDFKVNKTAFPDLSSLHSTLNASNLKLSVSVQASLTANTSSDYYINAQQDDALIKSILYPDNNFQGALTTQVYEKDRVFLDFFNNKSGDIWTQGLSDLYNQVPFDGLSLDMNEPSTVCSGECPDGQPQNSSYTERRKLNVKDNSGYVYTSYGDQSLNSTYDLPFIPGKYNLDNMTLSLNATHPSTNLSEYDVHSLFGHMQAMQTKQVMDNSIPALGGNRNFILTRNTFAATGKYASHWLGNNQANWDDMVYSISNIMNFNMFGIPLTGPDTCGFYGQSNETEELCARWIQLASFYPFSRWNSDNVEAPNQPFQMSDTHQKWVKNALNQKLQFARQMYSCLRDARDGGGTCFDPLFFHFPTDGETFKKIEESFIYANALKVTPILSKDVSQGNSSLQSYFPKGHWVNMNNYKEIIKSDGGPDGWKNLTVDQSENSMVGLHLMPGKWVAKQEGQFMTTTDLTPGTKSNITFIANRDQNGAAYTKIYFDNGIRESDGPEGQYELLLSANSIKKWKIMDDEGARGWEHIQSFVITDAEDLNSTNFACIAYQENLSTSILFQDYDQDLKTLTIYAANSTIDLSAMKDIYFGDSNKEGSNYAFCNDVISSGSYVVKGDELPDTSGNQVSFQLAATNYQSRPTLNMTLSVLNGGILNIHYTFADENMSKPFEVPQDIVEVNRTDLMEGAKLSDYLQVYNQSLFQMGIIYKGAMCMRLEDIVLGKHVNNMKFTTFENDDGLSRMMGLFERYTNDLFINSGAYAMWNRDAGNPDMTQSLPAANAYSTHPLIAALTPGADYYYAVYFNNLAGIDYWTTVDTESEKGKNTIWKTRASGGVGDIFFVFTDDQSEKNSYRHLFQKYHKYIVGLPVMVPQWSFGWHQSKWGYQTTDDIRDVVGNFSEYDLPLDAMWSDIDWMDNYRNFQPDPDRFGDIKNLTDTLHEKHMHYVPIIDAGLAQREQTDHEYSQYLAGKQKDVFIKNQAGESITGMVWPNDAVFPDFYNPDTKEWWKDMLSQMWETVGFDGLWLDMNEISNFCDGACYDNQASDSPLLQELPYIPTGRNIQAKSMSLDGLHYGNITELDAHSSFGTLEVKATHDWFKEVQKQRTFIIGRSSSAGMGKYGSMWGGDNESNEHSWYLSIWETYQHQVLGIPMFGVDICGFGGDTNPELCARWYQLGAFYPFSRNHNAWNNRPQEPYQFASDVYEGVITYTDIIRQGMRKKYNLIRYMYTEYSHITKEGGTLFQPLFFDWQLDSQYNEPNDFMLGSALKISVLTGTLNQNTTSFFFPGGTWCSLLNPKLKCDTGDDRNLNLQSKAYDSYAHLRMGYIVPWQDAVSLGVNSIYELQQLPVDIIINPTCSDDNVCTAQGTYINDDGLVLDREGYMNNYTFSFNYTPGNSFVLTITTESKATEVKEARVNNNDLLGTIQVTDAKNVINGVNFKALNSHKLQDDPLVAVYNEDTDRLVLNFTATGDERWLPDQDQITFTVQN